MKQRYLRRGTIVTLFIILAFVLSATGYSQMKKQPKTKKVLLKPDIQIQNIKTEKIESLPGGDHKIKVKVTVKNVSKNKNCTGPFKIQFLRRTSPSGLYKNIGQAGVAKLCYDPTSSKLLTETRFVEDTVPNGKTHYYKIRVDSPNRVLESNENNNTNPSDVEYTTPRTIQANMQAQARAADMIPPCDGVDLIITNVQVINAPSGMFMKATIKNRCTGSCTGPIVIEIDESDVLGAGRGLEQQVAGGIGSKAEFTMFSALGVAYDNDRDCRYIVKVRADSPCSETNTGNNEYEVTIPRGQRP